MTALTSLPVELIVHIADINGPASHAGLAFTCRYLAEAVQDLLKRHQAAYRDRQCSDIDPGTIPRVLKSVLNDSIAAYHVRAIRIWCTRMRWEHWRPVQLAEAEEGGDQSPSDSESDDEQLFTPWTFARRMERRRDFFTREEPLQPSLSTSDIEQYLSAMAHYLPDFGEDSPLREEARKELARGNDGFLKILLALSCPRLDALYFGRAHEESARTSSGSGTSLQWLELVTMAHRDRDNSQWPPGLQALRHLALSVETGTWLDEQEVSTGESWMPKLLNLPNLESLYFHGWRVEPDNED
ncbi:hypothetical protein CBER1_08151 [Cercospora berteroae]|uniref:Uncharacterized protein n=1 Tax=Cercospora berteroae TaxID=357750 RepID=A0A2S6CLI5_9PEZI|nr:hypothetical protein CBER1_08151 [Cercospora berteroae]